MNRKNRKACISSFLLTKMLFFQKKNEHKLDTIHVKSSWSCSKDFTDVRQQLLLVHIDLNKVYYSTPLYCMEIFENVIVNRPIMFGHKLNIFSNTIRRKQTNTGWYKSKILQHPHLFDIELFQKNQPIHLHTSIKQLPKTVC